MPEVVTVRLEELFAVLVPKAFACQYQVSPAGGVPLAVIVTPMSEHCGEFDVGLDGFEGKVITLPSTITSSLTQFVVVELVFTKYNLKVTIPIFVKLADGRVMVSVLITVDDDPCAISVA